MQGVDIRSSSAIDEENDVVLGRLLDNFVEWKPRAEEYVAVREYGLKGARNQCNAQGTVSTFCGISPRDMELEPRCQAGCQKTVSNNLQVLFLLGGFVCKVTRRHRIKPEDFDLSLFSSKHIEHYMLDFLRYLHSTRQLMFSTIANYMNSLVVLAKFWFVDEPLADLSFRYDTINADTVLAGLRRLRDQTSAKAKAEAIQKPVHSQWLSWQDCQAARNRCIAEYDSSREGTEAERDLKNKRYIQLKRLVCLMMYTIAPPPRYSIVCCIFAVSL